MNGYQLMLVMKDIEADIQFKMRLTNPKGLNRLRAEYKNLLGLPKNTKLIYLYEALLHNVVYANRDKFNQDFIHHCEDFYEEQFTGDFND